MNEASQDIAEIPTLLNDAYERFRTGRFSDSEVLLEKGLALDYEHAGVLAALKCAHFWKERAKRLDDFDGDFERGEYLVKEWAVFTGFLKRESNGPEQAIFAAKQWVFGKALGCYLKVLDATPGQDPDLLYRIGRCYKGKGNYKQAIEYFEACNHQRSDDAMVLAELADCYALIDEMKASKIFFREAFYMDPMRIDIDSIECTMMRRLRERVESVGRVGNDLLEWIPVYGVVFGVFTVKRELRSLEYGKLKQAIYGLESALADEGDIDGTRTPRLLNRYFWLIDHYLVTGGDREKIDETISKIRGLNSEIHEEYIN